MDCEWVELLLADLLDGACADPLREKIEGHLEGCARCRAGRDALAAVDAGLAGLRAPEPPPGLVDGAMRAALRPAPAVSRWRDLRTLAAAAALLAAALGAFGLVGEDLQAYVPDGATVANLTGAVSRTGETLKNTVLDFARERLNLIGG